MRTATEWITKIRNTARRDVEEKQKRAEHIDRVLIRIPGKVYQYVSDAFTGSYSHVVLYIPWNQDIESAVLEILHEAGWEIIGTHFYDNDGSMKIEFNHPDLENKSTFWNDLVLYKISNLEGSTCHKVKVGTKEVDVYEMECNEA